MDSAAFDSLPPRTEVPLSTSVTNALKIVIVGGFGVGKTTMVRSVSEIRPLDTEATMTNTGVGIDDLTGAPGKSTTTVAFDFGRITLGAENVLYLFGAPGQQRFWFLWDRLFAGALGAIVLVDQRRIADSWYAIDRLEAQGTSFVVACNNFEPTGTRADEIRDALDLDPGVPLLECDARSRDSSASVLIALVEHIFSGVSRTSALPADPESTLHELS